ncbi:MAG: tetratricopeptide repeat protein [Deltaproteobacteria bacterium]|nr:tetratricopeptide repeat protein [Deltaproteobacteria bacterium]
MQELRGNLSQTSLPQLLHRIYVEPDPCGVLDIARGQTMRHFFFKNGRLVAASSNVLNEVIGRLLVAEKVITQTDYELSLEKVVNEKRRHGEVLISMGLITERELNEFLASQFKRRIWKVMGLPDGTFAYHTAAVVSSGIEQAPAHPAFLILEGLSHGFYPAQRLETDLKPYLDTVYKAATYTGRYRSADFDLNLQEARFLKLFDGNMTLTQAMDASALLRHRAESLAMAFIITGMIRTQKAGEEEEDAGAPIPEPGETTFEPIPVTVVAEPAVVIEPPVQPGPQPVPQRAPAALFNAERLFGQAKTALNAKDYPAAVELFKEISVLNPQEAEYKAYLAWTHYSRDLATALKAGEVLRELLTANPEIPEAWRFLGNIYLASGFPEAAEKAFRTALSKNPRLLDTLSIVKLQEFKRSARPFDDASVRRRYMEYYGFLEDPLTEEPDARYFVNHSGVAPAIDAALGAIKKRAGHVLIQGTPGAGKTSAAFELIRRLNGEKIMVAFLLDAYSDKRAFLRAIDAEFRCSTAGSLKDDLLSLTMAIEQNHLKGGGALIVIDRANELCDECLALVGELMRHKYLQVVLIGLPVLGARLKTPAFRETNSKITVHQTLSPISAGETRAYLAKRLAAVPRYVLAGTNAASADFDEKTAGRVHEMSGGTLRLLNRLCARALGVAATMAKSTIDNDVIHAVSESFKGNPL